MPSGSTVVASTFALSRSSAATIGSCLAPNGRGVWRAAAGACVGIHKKRIVQYGSGREWLLKRAFAIPIPATRGSGTIVQQGPRLVTRSASTAAP